MSIKVNIQGLDGSQRDAIAKILDKHAAEMDSLVNDGEQISGRVSALTSKTQALITAVELRGAGEGDAAKLRAEVRRLMREVENLTIERDRLREKTNVRQAEAALQGDANTRCLPVPRNNL